MKTAPTVVVVEHDPLLRTLICEELEEHHIHAEEAALCDALKLLKKKKPDGVLLDFPYPVDGAFDVLKFMKTQGKNVPVIVMTNLNLEEEEVQELGACKLLVKCDMDYPDICNVMRKQLSSVKSRVCKSK